MIVVFGTVCLDRVLQVPGLPRPGGYVEITAESDFLGGEAANTANALHSWGAEVVLYGNHLGAGPEAEMLRSMLREHDLVNLGDKRASTQGRSLAPVCDIYVTPDGERTMFGRGFSTMEGSLNLERMPVKASQWFTAEPNMSSLSREAVRKAHAAGMNCYLMDFMREDDPIFPGSFWQCSTDWMGVRDNPQANFDLIQRWVDRYGCFAVLSDGPHGLVAGSPDRQVRHYPPVPAPKVVDSTGAGDMFRAGMLFGLDQRWEISECLLFAAAAGSLKCGTLGATQAVPSVEAIRKLLESHPAIADAYRQ